MMPDFTYNVYFKYEMQYKQTKKKGGEGTTLGGNDCKRIRMKKQRFKYFKIT